MNPFILKPYDGEKWFCDPKKETKELTEAIKNKRHVTLHSIRRMGKTGLIVHVQTLLPRKYMPVYMDILDT